MVRTHTLRIFIVFLLAFLPFRSFIQDTYAQEWSKREIIEHIEQRLMEQGAVLKGGAGTILDLPEDICSDANYIDLVPPVIPDDAFSIEWDITTYVGGEEFHPEWADYVGTGKDRVLRFYPDRVTEPYFSSEIFFTYVIRASYIPYPIVGTGFDYTYVHKRPTAYDFGSDVEICEGATTTLTLQGSEQGMRYQLHRDGVPVGFPITGIGNPINFSVSEPGLYTVEASNPGGDGICVKPMNGSANVVVNPIPVPTPSSDKTSYCEGDPIQLIGGPAGMASYTWEYPDGTIVNQQNPIIPAAVRAEHHGTYRLTVQSADGCEASANYSITVNTNPTAILPDDFEVCADDLLNFSVTVTGGTGPYTYAWTKDGNPIAASTATINIPAASVSDAGLYEVVVTDANGCGTSTAAINITVNPRPSATVSNNGPVCVSGSLQLTASDVTGTAPFTFSWTGPNGITSNVQNPVINPVTLLHAGDYTLTVSDANGCSSEQLTTTVVVNSLPTPSLIGAASFCYGATEVYTAGGGVNYTFTLYQGAAIVDGPVSGVGNTYTTSATLPAGDYTLNVLVVDANGCEAEADYSFTVYATPAATIAFDPAVICEGGSSNLIITLTTGTPAWSALFNNGTEDINTGSVAGTVYTLPVTATTDLSYTLKSISDANCSATIDAPATLTVNEQPTVTVNSSNPPTNQVCVGNDLTLTATGAGGSGNYVYSWSKDGETITGATGATYTITNAQSTDAGTYSVVVIDTEGGVSCVSDPAEIDVVVTEATATLIGAASFCYGATEVYTAGGGVNYTFTLYQGAAIVDGPVSGVGNTYTTSATLPAGDYTLNVLVVDANGCEAEADYSFTVYATPAATIAFDPAVICEGGSSNLIITLTTGTPAWSALFNNGTEDINTGSVAGTVYTLPVTATTDLSYTLKSISDANCSATIDAPATLTVNEQPTVTVNSSNPPTNQVCVGNDLTLTATGAGGSGNYVYSWSKDGETITGATGATYTITNAQSTDAGTYSVVVIDTEGGVSCVSDPAEIDVVVTQATATLIGATEVCEGTVETYQATGGESYSFELFSLPTNTLIDTKAGVEDTYEIPATLTVGWYRIDVTVVDANGCEDTESLELEVKTTPSADLTFSSENICEGEEITVTATPGYTRYVFMVNGNVVQDGAENTYVSALFEEGDIVKAAITLGSCIVESAETTITVRELPVVELSSDKTDNVVCLGEEIVFTATGTATSYAFYINDISGTPVQGPDAANTYSSSDLNSGDIIIVVGEGANGCSSTAQLAVTVNTPVATLTANKEELCVNETLVLTANNGAQYEFFRNGVSLRLSTVNPLEITDPQDADEFYVVVINEFGCEAISSTLTISVNPVPTVVLDSDKDEICKGELVTFEATGTGLVNYTFYRIRGGEETQLQSGADNQLSASDFEDGDRVYVVVSDGNMCNNASSEITITVHELPIATIIVLPSNQIGEGDDVTVVAGGGDEYLYLVNGLPWDGDINGWTTDTSIELTGLTDGDKLSVIARNAFGCTDESDDVVITTVPYPNAFEVLPEYSEYCSDVPGVRLYLSTYEDIGVVYELYDVNELATPFKGMGDGSVENGQFGWNDIPEGEYIVKAFKNLGGNTLTIESDNSAVVVRNLVPAVFDMNPAGTTEDCPIDITVTNTEIDVTYYLLLNGSVFSEPQYGTGASYHFGSVNTTGDYTIMAVNAAGCTSIMNGVLTVETVPFSGEYLLTSDPISGEYCEDGDGVVLTLDGSTVGINYELYLYDVPTGTIMTGTGEQLVFPAVFDEGIYRVVASEGTGCGMTMQGEVWVVINQLPTAFAIEADNDGYFCPESDGVEIKMAGQEAGVEYQLFFNGAAVSPKIIGGDNPVLPLSFGKYDEAGEYIVIGASGAGCETEIGKITIHIDDTPEVFTFTGDVGFCEGSNPEFTLLGSEAGVEYELYLDGTPLGITVMGTGAPIAFTGTIEGEYSVWASLITDHNVCKVEMDGSIIVAEKPLPDVTNVTVDIEASTGTDCSNGLVINISNPQVGVVYELYRMNAAGDHVPTGNVISAENGEATISFEPVVDKDADYFVYANLDGCKAVFADSISVDVQGAIARYSILGDSDLCEGDGGATIYLDDSDVDVTYTLINTTTGLAHPGKPGTGSALVWTNLIDEGEYIIEAENGTEACRQTMLGEFNLMFHKLPESYTLVASHNVFCAGSNVEISLKTTEAGVSYSLFRSNTPDGPKAFVATKIGDGGELVFTGIATEGYFSVIATSPEGCTSSMNEILHITENSVIDAGSVTIAHTAEFCSEDGTELVISNTQQDVIYTLIREGAVIDSRISAADGASIEFTGIKAGIYSVTASYNGACEIVVDPAYEVEASWKTPAKPVITSYNSYCQYDAVVSIETSEPGVSYYLVEYGDLTVGLAGTDTIPGTGEAIEWDLSLLPLGSTFFTVVAVSDEGQCIAMSDLFEINLNECEQPVGEYFIDIDALEYCSDDDGIILTVHGTTDGVYYELVEVGNEDVPIQIIKGNGGSVAFGNPIKGTKTYTITVMGSNEHFAIDGGVFTVVENSAPNQYMISSGGPVNVHEITLSGSDEDVWYFIMRNGQIDFDRTPLVGDGNLLNFGPVNNPGDYHVLAVSPAGCEALMDGTAVIYQSQLVAVADTLYLGPGDLVGVIDLGLNDADYFLPGVDITGETGNIRFSLVDEEGIVDADINEITGFLTYRKLPSFYGKDSLTYVVKNIDVVGRMATGKIIVMVGNKDFDEERSFLLPNAFSPNGDEINDRFVISGLGVTAESSLEVYNRWGTIVYRSNGKQYDNSWDGRSNVGAMVSIGKELPNGVYFYIFKVSKNIEGKLEERTYTGYVELRR